MGYGKMPAGGAKPVPKVKQVTPQVRAKPGQRGQTGIASPGGSVNPQTDGGGMGGNSSAELHKRVIGR